MTFKNLSFLKQNLMNLMVNETICKINYQFQELSNEIKKFLQEQCIVQCSTSANVLFNFEGKKRSAFTTSFRASNGLFCQGQKVVEKRLAKLLKFLKNAFVLIRVELKKNHWDFFSSIFCCSLVPSSTVVTTTKKERSYWRKWVNS